MKLNKVLLFAIHAMGSCTFFSGITANAGLCTGVDGKGNVVKLTDASGTETGEIIQYPNPGHCSRKNSGYQTAAAGKLFRNSHGTVVPVAGNKEINSSSAAAIKNRENLAETGEVIGNIFKDVVMNA